MDPLTSFSIEELASSDSFNYISQLANLDFLCNRPPWSSTIFQAEFSLKYSRIFGGFAIPNHQESSAILKIDNQKPELIAFLVLHTMFDEITIANIGIHPDCRKKGFASFLLNKTFDIATVEKIKTVTLEVRESNLSAINLYKKFGFIEVGKRPGYYSDNRETALIMTADMPERILA